MNSGLQKIRPVLIESYKSFSLPFRSVFFQLREKVQAILSDHSKFFVIGITVHFFLEKLPQSFNNVKIWAVGWQKQQPDCYGFFNKKPDKFAPVISGIIKNNLNLTYWLL